MDLFEEKNISAFIYFYSKKGLSDPFRLSYGKTTLGSALGCDIRVKDEQDVFCVLDSNELGVTTLVNRHEDDKIVVNEKPAKRYTVLRDGDHFQIGKKRFKYANSNTTEEDLRAVELAILKKLGQNTFQRRSGNGSRNNSLSKMCSKIVPSPKRRLSAGSVLMVRSTPRVSERNLLLSGCTSTPKNKFPQRTSKSRNSTLSALKENAEVNNFVVEEVSTKRQSYHKEPMLANKNQMTSQRNNLDSSVSSCMTVIGKKMYTGNLSDASEISTPENCISAVSITPLNVSKKTNKNLNKSGKNLQYSNVEATTTPKSTIKSRRSSLVYRPLVENITPVSPLPRSSPRISSLKKPAFTQRRSVNFDISSSSEKSDSKDPVLIERNDEASAKGMKRKRSLSDSSSRIDPRRKLAKNNSFLDSSSEDITDQHHFSEGDSALFELSLLSNRSSIGSVFESGDQSLRKGNMPKKSSIKQNKYLATAADDSIFKTPGKAAPKTPKIKENSAKKANSFLRSNESQSSIGSRRSSNSYLLTENSFSEYPDTSPTINDMMVSEFSIVSHDSMSKTPRKSDTRVSNKCEVPGVENMDSAESNSSARVATKSGSMIDVSLDRSGGVISCQSGGTPSLRLCSNKRAVKKDEVVENSFVVNSRRSKRFSSKSSILHFEENEKNESPSIIELLSVDESMGNILNQSGNKNLNISQKSARLSTRSLKTLITTNLKKERNNDMDETFEYGGTISSMHLSSVSKYDSTVDPIVDSTRKSIRNSTNSKTTNSAVSEEESLKSLVRENSQSAKLRMNNSSAKGKIPDIFINSQPLNVSSESNISIEIEGVNLVNKVVSSTPLHSVKTRSPKSRPISAKALSRSSTPMSTIVSTTDHSINFRDSISEKSRSISRSKTNNKVASKSAILSGLSNTLMRVSTRSTSRQSQNLSVEGLKSLQSVKLVDVSSSLLDTTSADSTFSFRSAKSNTTSYYERNDSVQSRHSSISSKQQTSARSDGSSRKSRSNKSSKTFNLGVSKTANSITKKNLSVSYLKTPTYAATELASKTLPPVHLNVCERTSLLKLPSKSYLSDASETQSLVESPFKNANRSTARTPKPASKTPKHSAKETPTESLDSMIFDNLNTSRNARRSSRSFEVSTLGNTPNSVRRSNRTESTSITNRTHESAMIGTPEDTKNTSAKSANSMAFNSSQENISRNTSRSMRNESLISVKSPKSFVMEPTNDLAKSVSKSVSFADLSSSRKSKAALSSSRHSNVSLNSSRGSGASKSSEISNNISYSFIDISVDDIESIDSGVRKSGRISRPSLDVNVYELYDPKKTRSNTSTLSRSLNNVSANVSGNKLSKSPKPSLPSNDNFLTSMTPRNDSASIGKFVKTPKSTGSSEIDSINIPGIGRLLKEPKVSGVETMVQTTRAAKSPRDDLTDVRGVKKLMKTPIAAKSPRDDLTNVSGVEQLLKTPRATKSPLNDLTNVNGVKELMKISRAAKSPKNDLTNVAGIKKIMQTPKHQKSPQNDLTNVSGVKKIMKTPKVQKSPKNDLTSVFGVKQTMKTPKVQKSPKNDLTCVSGVKKIMKTPKVQKSPKNDLTCVSGVKKIMKTPRVHKSPKNDLTCVSGVKKIMKTPRVHKSPKNDLTNVFGVKKIMKSPKVQKSPKNDLTQVVGLKNLMATPREQKPPKNDLTKVAGIRKLMDTPKEGKLPKNDLTNIAGVKKLMSSPKAQKEPKNDLTDVCGVRSLFKLSKTKTSNVLDQSGPFGIDLLFESKDEFFNIVSNKKQLRTYQRSPKKLEKQSDREETPDIHEHVLHWVEQQTLLKRNQSPDAFKDKSTVKPKSRRGQKQKSVEVSKKEVENIAEPSTVRTRRGQKQAKAEKQFEEMNNTASNEGFENSEEPTSVGPEKRRKKPAQRNTPRTDNKYANRKEKNETRKLSTSAENKIEAGNTEEPTSVRSRRGQKQLIQKTTSSRDDYSPEDKRKKEIITQEKSAENEKASKSNEEGKPVRTRKGKKQPAPIKGSNEDRSPIKKEENGDDTLFKSAENEKVVISPNKKDNTRIKSTKHEEFDGTKSVRNRRGRKQPAQKETYDEDCGTSSNEKGARESRTPSKPAESEGIENTSLRTRRGKKQSAPKETSNKYVGSPNKKEIKEVKTPSKPDESTPLPIKKGKKQPALKKTSEEDVRSTNREETTEARIPSKPDENSSLGTRRGKKLPALKRTSDEDGSSPNKKSMREANTPSNSDRNDGVETTPLRTRRGKKQSAQRKTTDEENSSPKKVKKETNSRSKTAKNEKAVENTEDEENVPKRRGRKQPVSKKNPDEESSPKKEKLEGRTLRSRKGHTTK